MSQRTTMEDPLAAAREALGRHACREAFDLLTKVDEEGELSAPDLELLAEAAWWSGEMDACIAAREWAYSLHLEAGNPRRAAAVALWLARDHGGRLAQAQSNSWFKRAERLLENEPDSVEHGYLQMMQARRAHMGGDFDLAVEFGRKAVDAGARFGDPDLQALALMYQGMGKVGRGEAEEGLALLDEATVAAVGGELTPMMTGVVYCNMISTCQELAEYRRAGEWTDAAKRWCDRQAISGFPGLCRVHRAEIIRLRGAWAEAEEEARRACTELMDHGLPAYAGDGFYEVGEIRLRMGDLAAAEAAFEQANELGRDPQPGLALLRMAQGNVEAAVALLRRSLEETTEPLQRVRRLAVQVEVAVAAGDLETAEAAAGELEGIAERFGSDALHVWQPPPEPASSSRAERPMRLFGRRAVGGRCGGPSTPLRGRPGAGHPRSCLPGRWRRGEGRPRAARRSALEKLGAVPDAMRVSELLGDMATSVATRRVTRTFMFTDIVRSTNLVEAIGDEAWEDLVRWHDRTLRAAFEEHRGQEVDHAGDGFFVAFQDPGSALARAVAIQRRLAEHRRTQGFAPQVRIGIHAAEATDLGEDYRGKGVHRAARIGGLAESGEILVSAETLAAAVGSWEASGIREVSLKGFAEPAQVATVDWR